MDVVLQQAGEALGDLAALTLRAAGRATPGWLLVALVLHSASLGCRVRVWQLLLRAALPGRSVPFGAALVPYLVSVGANVVAPLRTGDALRVALVRRTLPGVHSAAVLGTLAAEAIPGLIVVPLLVAAALALGMLPAGAGLAVAVVGSAAVLASGAWWLARHAASLRGGTRVGRFVADLASGLRLAGSPLRFARTVGPPATLDWTLRIATMAALLAAFHVGADPVAAAAVVAVVSLTTLVPIVPNGAGAQQAAVAAALHGHASTAALVGFSAGAQLLAGAVNLLAGGVALVVLRCQRPAAPPVLQPAGTCDLH
jgi:uncharacterized membrane protein YbhN (UPF0104 family)